MTWFSREESPLPIIIEIMNDLLDWFQLTEFIPIMALTFILTFIGKNMAADYEQVQRCNSWFTAIAFLIYASMGISEWGIWDATRAVVIAMRALLAAAVAYGVGSILFSVFFALWLQWEVIKPKPKRPVWIEPAPIAPIEKLPEPKPPPPPPPSPEERASRARTQYEERLELIAWANLGELEETAAKEKALQSYLKEIDKVIT